MKIIYITYSTILYFNAFNIFSYITRNRSKITIKMFKKHLKRQKCTKKILNTLKVRKMLRLQYGMLETHL